MNSEHVGNCVQCNTNIYCRDGFLDGIVDDSKNLYCHACYADKTHAADASGHADAPSE